MKLVIVVYIKNGCLVNFTGSLKGTLTGAATGAVFGAIGGSFNGTSYEGGLLHIGSHALAGGVISELQGGNFGHGFWSAGLTKAANVNGIVGTDQGVEWTMLRVAAAATLGGTISKLTGGKFANGAVTAAFAQAYNGEDSAEAQDKFKKSVNAAMHDVANIDRNTPEGRARLAAYLVLNGQAKNLDEAYKLAGSGKAMSLHFKLNYKLVKLNYQTSVKAFEAFVQGGIDDNINFKLGLDISAAASGSLRLTGASYIFDYKTLIDASNLGSSLIRDNGLMGLVDEGQNYLLKKHGE